MEGTYNLWVGTTKRDNERGRTKGSNEGKCKKGFKKKNARKENKNQICVLSSEITWLNSKPYIIFFCK